VIHSEPFEQPRKNPMAVYVKMAQADPPINKHTMEIAAFSLFLCNGFICLLVSVWISNSLLDERQQKIEAGFDLFFNDEFLVATVAAFPIVTVSAFTDWNAAFIANVAVCRLLRHGANFQGGFSALHGIGDSLRPIP
jgi:hypothetical protein